MSIVYDIEVLEENDPYIAIAEKIAHAGVTILLHGAYIVDFIPIRKGSPLSVRRVQPAHVNSVKHIPAWLPGAGFKRNALEWRKSVMALLNKPYDAFHARRVSPLFPSSNYQFHLHL